jgi:NitT/TauT family transport system substrate-binding protein
MPFVQTRRRLLTDLAFVGAAGLGGVGLSSLSGSGQSHASEPPPEITTIRLAKAPITCVAPQYIAAELLRIEGFTDIQYVGLEGDIGKRGVPAMIGHDHIDFSMTFAAPMLIPMDAGEPITALAGVHVGCFEVFGHEGIRSIADLKGRSVGIPYSSSSPHTFLTIMTSYIGLDPMKDINWVITSPVQPKQLFIERKIDAILSFPPETQELRAQDRQCNRRQRSGSPMVEVFLLHTRGQHGICQEISRCNQARVACDSQGDGSLRFGTKARCATNDRPRLRYSQ